MTTPRTYRSAKARVALAFSLVLLVTAALAIGTQAHAGSANEGCTGSYGWPVRPFDRMHQIRGAFGDPRTQFAGPPTRETLFSGSGKFLFHDGTDITAADGTAVYPVASGVVIRRTKEMVAIDCGNGRAFEYWHIAPRVGIGQRVVADQTVLGRILRGQSHVHLTQLDHGYPTNPATGGLSPYRDTTTPRMLDISLRQGEGSADEIPQFIRGRVYLLAEAIDTAEPIDTPGLRTPGVFRNWPVTPARLTWRIDSWNGNAVVREHVARDVRRSLPDPGAFWNTFARGTYQGQSVFGPHYSYLQPGHYVFKLTPRPFDTHALRDGVYDLVVTAEDVAGHADTQTLRFTVHNAAGWAGKA
jgi:hypothetical protein